MARFANPPLWRQSGYIDDVIQPHETRKRVCRSLAMPGEKSWTTCGASIGNISCSRYGQGKLRR